MKIEELVKKATQGPCRVTSLQTGPTIDVLGANGEYVADFTSEDTEEDIQQANTLLFVHSRNNFLSALEMLKWITGFYQDGDAKAVVDGEPMRQAKRLITRLENVNDHNL